MRNLQGTLPPVPPAQVGIVAKAGGGQATATQLTAAFNTVATVATAADSVVLPAAVQGLEISVQNDGANSMQVFGLGTDTINGAAAATGVAQAATKLGFYVCHADGKWLRLLSA